MGPVTEQAECLRHKTVGELASFPLEALKSITGSPDAAAELKEYAFGRDSRKLELNAGRKSVSEEITFPQDIHEKDYILTVLFDLASEVGYRLSSKGLKARTVGL